MPFETVDKFEIKASAPFILHLKGMGLSIVKLST